MTRLYPNGIPLPEIILAQAAAEEVTISNVTWTAEGHEGGLGSVSFGIRWVGSWRTADSYTWGDAAWVFLKACYGQDRYGADVWEPVRLVTEARAHTSPDKCKVLPAEDGLGAFIHLRRVPNPGNSWFFFGSVDGRAKLEVKLRRRPQRIAVFALRMVYLEDSAFWAGNPTNTVTGALHDGCRMAAGDQNTAFRIESETAIEVVRSLRECPADEQRLIYSARGGDQSGPVPAEFPKGYRGFFIMRSHITQGQYSDFINSLRGDEKTLRFPYAAGAYRYTIRRDRNNARIPTRPRRACNYLSWDDGTAYAAWAGLRPMTELEFERACYAETGDLTSGRYAWGNTNIALAQVIQGLGDLETVLANCNTGNRNVEFDGGDGGQGPVRDDSFVLPGAAAMTSKRQGLNVGEEYGSSPLGILGLSGNLWEMCVTLGNPAGRSFVGNHGQGTLEGASVPTDLGWPSKRGGFGFRGGSWYTEPDKCRVADRSYATALGGRYKYRSHDVGFRCVRTAPTDLGKG